MLQVSQEKGIKEWTWIGPTSFSFRCDGPRGSWDRYQAFAHHPEGDDMTYAVQVLTYEVANPEG